jgi:hypothetical protein
MWVESDDGAVGIGTGRPDAAIFEDNKHAGGHAYPFFRGRATPPYVELLPHEIFQGSVTRMLTWHLPETSHLSKSGVR